MNRFAALLNRLADEPVDKLRLLVEYLRTEGDPDRGWALAAMTGGLALARLKPAGLRALIASRADPVLIALSHDYVGDLCEAIALLWPAPPAGGGGTHASNRPESASLSDILEACREAGAAGLAERLPGWLDSLDAEGRYALLKLVSGGLRTAVSGDLARAAVAALGSHSGPREIADIWHALAPPYLDLFAWMEGRGPRPHIDPVLPFHSPMPAQPVTADALVALKPEDFAAGWMWDGLRVQAVMGVDARGRRVQRVYAESGEDLSPAVPELIEALAASGLERVAFAGTLLVRRAGQLLPLGALRQRLARQRVTPALRAEFPLHLLVEDLLMAAGEDLRPLPSEARWGRLAALTAFCDPVSIALAPLLPFTKWEELAAARRDPASVGAGADAAAIGGVMLKRRDAPYAANAEPGTLLAWACDPRSAEAVLMYAQRAPAGLELTFGVWRAGAEGDEAVSIGKALFAAQADEMARLEHWLRAHTRNRFGPVREVDASADGGLVVQITFAGLHRSTRHKAGLVLTRPRIVALAWDRPARAADRLEMLAGLVRA